MPKLADGLELVGEFKGSGFKQAPYLVRRGDGQVLQISRLLYLVAEQIDGQRDPAAIAERVTARLDDKQMSAENVEFLVDKKLRPLGVVALADGTSPALPRRKKLFELQYRAAAVPERAVDLIAGALSVLFWPPVIVAVLAGLVAVDAWAFLHHGMAQGMREVLYQPAYLLVLLGLVVLSAAFHECGHAAACRYGGGKPGVIGVGIYFVWPVFYTDVTDTYRLSRGGRVRTDLGGVYFNAIFILATAAAYAVTGWEPLLLLLVIQHLEILHQFLPFLRMDGYYVLADLTGVPDLFTRLKPILLSLVPFRERDRQVTELKRWPRAVVTGWVVLIVPLLLGQLVLLIVTAPRIYATAWDSARQQLDMVETAWSAGKPIIVIAAIVGLVALCLPVGGLTMMFGRLSSRGLGGAWRRTDGYPFARAGLVVVVFGLAGILAYTWWPNGDYQPIQPEERWRLQDSAAAIGEIPRGRPALSLDGAPVAPSEFVSAESTDGASSFSPVVTVAGVSGTTATTLPAGDTSPAAGPEATTETTRMPTDEPSGTTTTSTDETTTTTVDETTTTTTDETTTTTTDETTTTTTDETTTTTTDPTTTTTVP